MRIGFLFDGEDAILLKELKKKSDSVNINVLASKECYGNTKINIIEKFKNEGIEIYPADIPIVKMMISDAKELFHTYTKFSEDKKSIMPNSAIGVWNQYEDVASNYQANFKKQFNKLKKKSKNTIYECLSRTKSAINASVALLEESGKISNSCLASSTLF